MILVECECDSSKACPQGRSIAQGRCRIWMNSAARDEMQVGALPRQNFEPVPLRMILSGRAERCH